VQQWFGVPYSPGGPHGSLSGAVAAPSGRPATEGHTLPDLAIRLLSAGDDVSTPYP